MTCKISIITITLNSAHYLEQTISSVIGQTYENKEYIIVDGGSTDGTLDIIKRYESKIDCWISESDNGISQAMNKALSLATGDYILFIHSDDYLLEERIIEKAVKFFIKSCDIYIFPVILDNFGVKRKSRNNALSWRTNFKMGSCHQGQFCSKELFLKLGSFDEKLKICMDYDFLLRAYRAGKEAARVDGLPVSVMRLTGISSRQEWPALRERFREERVIHKKYCSSIWMALVYQIYWSLYSPYRRLQSLLTS